jgi:DNA modification methylase
MTIKILNGDVLDHLKELPDNPIHCVCTSPRLNEQLVVA